MRSELHDRWDKIAAPRNCEELVKLLSDHKEPAEMFFAVDGVPYAYMEIPTGFPQDGDYRMPPSLRMVYRVLGYKKQLSDGEDESGVEAELVECFWRDMLHVRKIMDTTFGGTPILFWRKRPEFSISQEEGDKVRFARLYVRLEVPGFNWNKYPVFSYIGDSGLSKPWPAPVSEQRKEEIRLADEVARLGEVSSRTAQEHMNAFYKLISLRGEGQFNTAEMRYRSTEHNAAQEVDPAALYGTGVSGRPGVVAAGVRETNALRQLLDSQHMASHPGVFGGHKK